MVGIVIQSSPFFVVLRCIVCNFIVSLNFANLHAIISVIFIKQWRNINMSDISTYDKRAMEIGRRIRMERQRMGLSQEELAGTLKDNMYVSVGQNTISYWESGSRIPPLDRIVSLAQVFGCDVGYLLCDYDEHIRETADISEITGLRENTINILRASNNQKRAQRASVIDALVSNPWIIDTLYLYLNYNIDCAADIEEDEHGHKMVSDKFHNLVALVDSHAGEKGRGTVVNASLLGEAIMVELQGQLQKLKSKIQGEKSGQ
jgi:transcriptional regulator with XRE-family HTH domain